jgi:hypothetical protein
VEGRNDLSGRYVRVCFGGSGPMEIILRERWSPVIGSLSGNVYFSPPTLESHFTLVRPTTLISIVCAGPCVCPFCVVPTRRHARETNQIVRVLRLRDCVPVIKLHCQAHSQANRWDTFIISFLFSILLSIFVSLAWSCVPPTSGTGAAQANPLGFRLNAVGCF